MNRRQMLQGAGALAVAGIAANAIAEDRPPPASATGADLAKTAGDCVRTGEICLAHCIEMLGRGDTDMADCAKSVNQLIPLCAALQSLATQNAAYTAKLAKVVMQACSDCRKECEKFSQHPVCKACAQACADCYRQCVKIAA
jgi:Cys-rich four helix bundle protein (predicted Tat secretion target)